MKGLHMIKKLFGGIDLTWRKLIILAVLAGLYTGLMTLLPITADTSFRDITVTFEYWILFGILIIVNSKTPLDSALKAFVFFLISQPLVYLAQVPFSPDGFGIFRYYPTWFRWTLLTFPMAYIGWYMKKDQWWGALILAPMLALLGFSYSSYLGEVLIYFPRHLITTVFCAVTLFLYPLAIFKNKPARLIGLALSAVIFVGGTAYTLMHEDSHAYNTSLLLSGSETTGFEYDDTYTVYLEDPSFGDVSIGYEQAIECYLVNASFRKIGNTVIVLESPSGEKHYYDIYVQRSTYSVTPR